MSERRGAVRTDTPHKRQINTFGSTQAGIEEDGKKYTEPDKQTEDEKQEGSAEEKTRD